MLKICKRCDKKYKSPFPLAQNVGGFLEIATKEWCANCNAFVMHIIYRDRSAYNLPDVRLR